MKDKQLGSADHHGSVPYLLRLPAVLRTTGLGRSTLYRLISEGAFPPPVKLAKRASAWRQPEVQRWVNACAPAAHRQGLGTLSNRGREGSFSTQVDPNRGGRSA